MFMEVHGVLACREPHVPHAVPVVYKQSDHYQDLCLHACRIARQTLEHLGH